PNRRRHGAPPYGGLPRGAQRPRLRATEPAADVPESARPAARRAVLRRTARTDLVGLELRRHGEVDSEARLEPPELDAQDRRERRAAARPAAQADRSVPGRVEGGGTYARTACVGEPQHLRARR